MVFAALKRLKYICNSPSTDNFAFKLCYRWSTLLLVLFSFVVTCRLLFGNSFECIANEDFFPPSYMNSKCYETTVYTLPTKLIINKDPLVTPDPLYEDFRRHQSYYPWVNLLFLVHAFNFYLPHLLWKSYEKGYMHRLTAGVQKFFDDEEKRGLELCYLAKYVLVTQGKHKLYAAMYIFFEACNYAISLAQTLWLVHFFDVTGVPSFLPHVLQTWWEFQSFYFPSEGFCELFRMGPSGTPQRHRVLCNLPLNALYMKMFLFLYAWYIVITMMCGLVLIYRIALLVLSFRVFVSKVSSPLSEKSAMRAVCYSLSYSDWFFLSGLRKSMADVDFAHLVDKIVRVSEGKGQPSAENNARLSLYDDATTKFDFPDETSRV